MEKGEVDFWKGGVFWVIRDSNYKFILWLLLDLYTINGQTERFCITCYFLLMFLDYFVLLKNLLIVPYFINI